MHLFCIWHCEVQIILTVDFKFSPIYSMQANEFHHLIVTSYDSNKNATNGLIESGNAYGNLCCLITNFHQPCLMYRT